MWGGGGVVANREPGSYIDKALGKLNKLNSSHPVVSNTKAIVRNIKDIHVPSSRAPSRQWRFGSQFLYLKNPLYSEGQGLAVFQP